MATGQAYWRKTFFVVVLFVLCLYSTERSMTSVKDQILTWPFRSVLYAEHVFNVAIHMKFKVE